MTEQDFIKSTGYAPENDDLERANCRLGGIGHQWCGICRHGEVRFSCVKCIVLTCGRIPPSSLKAAPEAIR